MRPLFGAFIPIIGAFAAGAAGVLVALVAAPLVAVSSTLLAYLRERAQADRAPAEELQAAG